MSYERQAVAEGPATPAVISPMREEKVISPYNKASIGQVAIDKGKSAEGPALKTEDSVKLSPQVAALARREQKFRSEQAQLAKDKAAVAAEKAELASLRTMKDKIAAKDYSGVEELVPYDEYSQYQVNKANGSNPLQDELKKLEGKITQMEKSSEENLTQQYEAAVNERRVVAKDLIEKNPEFRVIKKANASEAIVQHILDTYEHDNEELSVEQAAKEVALLLNERAKKWAALLEEEKEVAQEQPRYLPPMKQGLKTLTQQVTAGELKRPTSYSHLSESDRWAKARQAVEERFLKQGR